jgi:tetratricopeptide (TPR) repeat protein
MPLRSIFFLCITFNAFLATPLQADEPSKIKLKTLYNSLDPASISKHLAFYELYWHTPEGQQALQDAYRLLSGGNQSTEQIALPTSMTTAIQAIVGLVNKHPSENTIELSDTELASINKLASRLPNRALPGYSATSEEQVLSLPASQIDLARGILLSQLGNDPESIKKIKSYEAIIDLMALQILARVSLNDSPKTKIRAINRFIFEEMGFRFPPHSTYAKDVDLYTFLPSVLDSRRGVCLGVSTLYLCLAQRLNLNLEIVTPPGHIYVRWHQGDQEINIETTARGIDLPSEEYLGVDTRSLQQRNIKETIGMAHFNQASVFWERQQYDKALVAYLKAKPYLPDDKMVMGFISFIYLLLDMPEEARPILEDIVDYLPDYAISKETIPEDYLNGNVSKEGIQAVFMRVNETRASLIAKRDALISALKKYPLFRDGYFSLAGTWMQLHRAGEALQVLERYHEIDPTNASVEYYMAELYADRMDYNKAWKHLRTAEQLTKERDHEPKALLSLKQKLVESCPE